MEEKKKDTKERTMTITEKTGREVVIPGHSVRVPRRTRGPF